MVQHENRDTRRSFIKKVTALGALSAAAPQLLSAMDAPAGKDRGEGSIFLFQGDSITDGNRTRNNDWNHVMGHGYQYIIASKLWYDFPDRNFHFFNRGISGNKVTDLAARWQKDTLDLKPDVLSILIGINDTSVWLNGDTGFSVEQYETGYRDLLEQTRQQLPAVQFVLCSPFVLPVGKVKDNWEGYSAEVAKRQEVVKRLAAGYDAVYVDFQEAFNRALSKAPAPYWIWDGVHPMPAGHELMAREWMRRAGKRMKWIR